MRRALRSSLADMGHEKHIRNAAQTSPTHVETYLRSIHRILSSRAAVFASPTAPQGQRAHALFKQLDACPHLDVSNLSARRRLLQSFD